MCAYLTEDKQGGDIGGVMVTRASGMVLAQVQLPSDVELLRTRRMGEDAQLEASGDDRALSPIPDESMRHEEGQDRWICSIDGSYAVGKEKFPYEPEELPPYSERSSIKQVPVEHVLSKDSLVMPFGVVLDDSQSFSKKSRSLLRVNDEFPSVIRIPQSLEMPLKQERLRPNASRRNDHRIRHVSPVRSSSAHQQHGKPISRANQIYDPLRRIVSQTSLASGNGFSSELQAQSDKLMNGLRAILNERLSKERLNQPSSSSCALDTLATALSRVGSESTVSTGRDLLTKEVRRLESAFAGVNLGVETGRAPAGGEFYRHPGGDITTSGAHNRPNTISQERPCSGSSGTLTVEQARLSSRGSVQALTDNAIRDAEDSSRLLRRLGGASSQLPTKLLREQSTNTNKDPIRHVVVTHRVKHADCCPGRNKLHSESFTSQLKPSYYQFMLKPTVDDCLQSLGLDPVHSDKHFHKQGTDGESLCAVDKRHEADSGGRRTEHIYRKTGGGKRGRPITAGRTLYGRGRVHFRPTPRRSDTCRGATMTPPVEQSHPVLHDAATSTEPEALETATEVVARDDIDLDEPECSIPEQPKPKSVISMQKMPFVGSGLKCSNTFSLVGNQQQVMKIVSIRFQEWLPLGGPKHYL
ncbi:hypothetical protein KIN20_013851 [Parelaphostrongylus tenuis]|uniref:Uncharacterized protein n=1 Tax=Parelaphostrongylus tenuis TaxID=148309 RepID=A0AAD5QRC1_PARTN|nr:hypothetical protein KIN20_013851 [Parelaphostrongylus tenuis]